MSAVDLLQALLCAAIALGIVALTVRWWRRRASDLSPSARAGGLAVAVTVLMGPALAATLLGLLWAQVWVLLVPVAWLIVGVTHVVEQHHARARDAELGAPRRAVLWHPWLVAAATFAVAYLAMILGLLAWTIVTGDITTSAVAAFGGAAACGPFVLGGAQAIRRAAAAGRADQIVRFTPAPAAGTAAGVLGLLGLVAAVAWTATAAAGTMGNEVSSVVLAPIPGWVLLGAAWIMLRPPPAASLS